MSRRPRRPLLLRHGAGRPEADFGARQIYVVHGCRRGAGAQPRRAGLSRGTRWQRPLGRCRLAAGVTPAFFSAKSGLGHLGQGSFPDIVSRPERDAGRVLTQRHRV